MKILIEDLEFEAIIGVLEVERVKPQRVVINLEIDYSFDGEYLDYVEIIQRVKELIQSKKYLLLEGAVGGVFELLKREFKKIESIKCKISKPDILNECIVSIEDEIKI